MQSESTTAKVSAKESCINQKARDNLPKTNCAKEALIVAKTMNYRCGQVDKLQLEQSGRCV